MRVFVSGLTGTLGSAIAALHAARGDQVWGCARSEARAAEWMRADGGANPRCATLFVCDAARLADPRSDVGRLLPTVSRVYHCAAMKHVDLCETNVTEGYAQNVALTATVAAACVEAGPRLIFASSDKACLPQGAYGAAKLMAERVVLRAGGAVVRLGNLIGSSGSVFAAWRDAVTRGERIRLTDPTMTRYFLPVADAAEFMADRHAVGRVVVPWPLLAAGMGDVARAVAGDAVDVVGRRPGETAHQWLIAPGDRVRLEGEFRRAVIDDAGEVAVQGMASNHARRWDVGELLRVAGVSPAERKGVA